MFPVELLGPLLSALRDANLCVDVTGRRAGRSARIGVLSGTPSKGAPEGVKPPENPHSGVGARDTRRLRHILGRWIQPAWELWLLNTTVTLRAWGLQ